MTEFQTIEGSKGLSLDEAAHIFIPGRGRTADGEGISVNSRDRVDTAANLYLQKDFERHMGYVICSGYKTPSDTNGRPWSPELLPRMEYTGVPEADGMRQRLIQQGLAATAIKVERNSIDTVTNFTYTEARSMFGQTDERPVAIVGQEEHLERIIKYVAPKTLKRDFIGVAVPEPGEKDKDSYLAQLVSRAVLFGVKPDTPNIEDITTRRFMSIWRNLNRIDRHIRKNPYKTDTVPNIDLID